MASYKAKTSISINIEHFVTTTKGETELVTNEEGLAVRLYHHPEGGEDEPVLQFPTTSTTTISQQQRSTSSSQKKEDPSKGNSAGSKGGSTAVALVGPNSPSSSTRNRNSNTDDKLLNGKRRHVNFDEAKGGNKDEEKVDIEKISWQCGKCGYYLISMDQFGVPIPLGKDAYGNPLPTECPKCEEEHDQWRSVEPFDEYGDYPNIKSSFAPRVHRGVPSSSRVPAVGIVEHRSAMSLSYRTTAEDAKAILAKKRGGEAGGKATQTITSKKEKGAQKAQCYYCNKCDRALIRMDSFGCVIPLELDAFGNVLPLYCVGCQVEHREWTLGPMRFAKKK